MFQRFPGFWTLQIGGWAVYLVMIYVTFLTVAAEGTLLRLLEIKGVRTVIGFLLTCILWRIYRQFIGRRSLGFLIILTLVASTLFGGLWTAAESGYSWLTSPNYNVALTLARLPRNALDYALTLTAWSALYFGIKHWQRWQIERENALASAALAKQAQLETLRYQLNPHFLFNALNSIRAVIDEDKARAKLLVTEFAEFLRYTLQDDGASRKPLGDELTAIRNYLAIEKIRFEEKLEIEFNVEPRAEKFLLPPFLLHPLVENAIKHGAMSAEKPLRIEFTAQTDDSSLLIAVTNTGTLRSNEHRTTNGHNSTNGTGTGLKNVRERLVQIFPGRSSFDIHQENGVVQATIQIRDEKTSGDYC